MTQSLYPETRDLRDDKQNIEQLIRNLQEIARIREVEDVSDFLNLNQRFVAGRGLFETRAAPSSPSNVLATDEEGDIVNDNTYEYKLLNISGTGLRWDRRALAVGW